MVHTKKITNFTDYYFNILKQVLVSQKFKKPAYKKGKPVNARIFIDLEFGKFD
jgi:hypothetical protein